MCLLHDQITIFWNVEQYDVSLQGKHISTSMDSDNYLIHRSIHLTEGIHENIKYYVFVTDLTTTDYTSTNEVGNEKLKQIRPKELRRMTRHAMPHVFIIPIPVAVQIQS